MAMFVLPAAIPVPAPAPPPVVPKNSPKDFAQSVADIAPYLVGGALLLFALQDKKVKDFLGELSDFLPVGLGARR